MMTFYTISRVSNYINNPLITSFHSAMFHGIALRGGVEYPHEQSVFAHTPDPASLSIIRTGRMVPPIFSPSINLVVNERLADVLRCISCIRLQRVTFEHVVDIAFYKGDMSPYNEDNDAHPEEQLRTLPESKLLRENIGPYYEVQLWRWQDIKDRYPATAPFTVEEGTPPLTQQTELRLSRELLNDFPIFWFGDIFVIADVFELLRNDLDFDFFLVREYDLSNHGSFRRIYF